MTDTAAMGNHERSRDFHEYVFKDGRLIGRFEEMYQSATNVPWNQDNIPDEFDVRLLKCVASSRAPYAKILDVGCGLGYFANELTGLGARVYGIDVSPTAIKELTATFPHIEACVYDLTVDRGASATLFPNAEAFQLVVCRGLFWYVFPQMSQVVRNIASWVDSQGYLLIHQNFPPLDTNFVGKDIIPTPACPLEFFLETTCFTLICENHY